MAFHVFDDVDQRNNFIVAVVAIPVCILVTIARLYVRRRKLGWEDVAAVLALVTFLVYAGCNLYILRAMNGVNVFHVGSLPKHTVISIFKVGFAMNTQTPLIQTFAKLSLLILYHRIFHVEQVFRFLVWGVGSFQVAFCIANVLVRIFVCTPFEAAVNPYIKGKCLNQNITLAWSGSINAFIDFVMIGMAWWMVQKLHVSLGDKLRVGILFAIGGFSGIIEVIKISLAYGSVGKSNLNATWNIAEQATAIICCCFPIYKPLFGSLRAFQQRALSYIYKTGSGRGSKSDMSASKETASLEYIVPHRPSNISDKHDNLTFVTEHRG